MRCVACVGVGVGGVGIDVGGVGTDVGVVVGFFFVISLILSLIFFVINKLGIELARIVIYCKLLKNILETSSRRKYTKEKGVH